jgi:subtilisin family serine protease
MLIRQGAFAALFLFLYGCGADDHAPAPAEPCTVSLSPTAAEAEPGTRFLVKVRGEGAGLARAEARLGARLGAGARLRAVAPGLYRVDSGEALTPPRLAARAGLDVEYVEPDLPVHEALASDDPDLGKQWAHGVVDSAEAWDLSRGDASVTVAVLDSGIDLTHVDLAANLWTNAGEVAGNGVDDDGNGYVDDVHGWDFVNDDDQPVADDSSYHGTHVSGTIGAVGNNGIGVSGQAQVVRLMPLKFLDHTGSGYTSDAIRGIDYAILQGAKVINNSWGTFGYSKSLDAAIARAEAAGVLFVAAAGNSGSNNTERPFYPASYARPNVISVAASTSSDRLASFSNHGTAVHLAAPGYKIYSTKNGNAYQTLSGTSMATPLVSGVLATMIALRPDLSYAQIKGALLSSVDVVPAMVDRVLWNGRVNAYRALSLVGSVAAGWVPPDPPSHGCP